MQHGLRLKKQLNLEGNALQAILYVTVKRVSNFTFSTQTQVYFSIHVI